MHSEVQLYFSKAKEEHLEDMHMLRTKILSALPDAKEGFEYGFPVYYLDGELQVGYAGRQKGLMFYVMDPNIVAAYHEDLATRITGKTCIIIKENSQTSKQTILRCIDHMLEDLMKKHVL
ncbi:DUF1801 domain-containing protein [Metabacillus idriensis]|uniref:YdhG-like domain-containing protein n=1 Tax=Metabacillus idriensis TaxID=324768 RepID=A0A6I2M8D7_9BACI|nr:DUF1801 domain-containing protein [Metabacillus idriensis]MCM3597340.1 DUF1801 domain-containing protein [Metabacillus idriensis]MRX54089.1 hypothetical protein [Metabacillus idriensis]